MVLYQNFIQWLHLLTKMDATVKLSLMLDPMGNLFNKLVWNHLVNWNQNLVKWSLGGFSQNCNLWPSSPYKMAATAKLTFILDPTGNSLKNLLLWNYLLNWNKNFGKMVFRWSSCIMVSDFPAIHSRWLPQPAVNFVLDTFPGERLQAPGSLWF